MPARQIRPQGLLPGPGRRLPPGEHRQRLGDDALRFGQPARPRVGAGQAPAVRVDDAQPTTAQRGHVLPGRRVGPHLGVHGGGEDHGGRRRQDRRGQHVIGATGRDPGQQVRRGGGHHDQVGPLPHRDVLDGGGILEQAAAHRAPGDRGERRGTDEAQRGLRGEGADLVPGLPQETDDEGRLVGGDGAGHADDDAPRAGRSGSWCGHGRLLAGGPGCAGTSSGLRRQRLRTGSRRGSWRTARPRPPRRAWRRRAGCRRTCPPPRRAAPSRPRRAGCGPHRPG